MSKFSIVALAFASIFAACETTKTAAPGAVDAKAACCAEGAKKEACCKDAAKAAAPGAVGEAKACDPAACAAKKAAGQCPLTGAAAPAPEAAPAAAPGAVGDEKKAGCCQKKAACPSTQG